MDKTISRTNRRKTADYRSRRLSSDKPHPRKNIATRRHQLGKNGFGVTPRGDGISVAGSISFTRLGSAPDFRRAQILIEKTKKLLPGISDNFGKPRFGLRPLCPDSLPIIDRAPSCRNAYIASGHGQFRADLGSNNRAANCGHHRRR